MRAGPCNKWVTLSRWPDTDTEVRGTPLSPAGVWAAIEPLSGSGDRTAFLLVRTRYHDEITVDTRVQYTDARRGRVRSFFVRHVLDVNEQGDEMRLEVEEVEP